MSLFHRVMAWGCFVMAVGTGLFGLAYGTPVERDELMPYRAYSMAMGCFFLCLAILYRLDELRGPAVPKETK